MKKIAILTSGGDSPGMNSAIRAAVRTALFHKIEIIGIYKGYTGLLTENFKELNASSVGNILQRGGTILQTSRSPEFMEESNRTKAADILKKNNIDGLIVIGGDGSFNGAFKLFREHNISVIGVPGTIDNDISGTDYTIGFDTAVQTAMEAVDKIRDTAFSHARTFIIEVMGRNSSAIAQKVGICTGAENVLVPNQTIDYGKIVGSINRGLSRGKLGSIVIVAEGHTVGRSYDIQKKLESDYKMKSHVCILGHTQRGGTPSAQDRFMGSQMGSLAAKALIEGEKAKATVYKDGVVKLVDLENCLIKDDSLFDQFSDLGEMLSI